MKKICFVVPRAYYLFNPTIKNYADKIGGAQKQSYLLSTELANNQEFDVHFCVADFGQPELEIVNKVKIWKSFNFNENLFIRFSKLYMTLKKIDADTYIFNASDIGVAVFTLIIKLLYRKRIVYILGADIELNFVEHKKMLGFFTAFSMLFTYKFANKIAVQSQQQYDLFLKKYNRKPNEIIKNIIEIQVPESYENRPNILWIGRIDKIKNPEIFIEMAGKYLEEKFLMIAPIILDDTEYGKKIQAEALKLPNLEFIDFVNPNDIDRYYKKAKIYVMTSESEGFSNTMLEAMANKCPVLSYKVNNDSIITKYNLGFCADGNLIHFYNDFEKMLDNNILLREFGENASRYLYENHMKAEIIDRFIRLLD
jgi:glycosyltransferase involved in cell wall biosynthesis